MNISKLLFLQTFRAHKILNICGTYRVLVNFSHFSQDLIIQHKSFLINSSKIHTSAVREEYKDFKSTSKELAPREQFFSEIKGRNKNVFLKVLETFNAKDRLKRGHIELIYAALKQMKEFGVETDLEVYKKLMDIFPKGKMIPKNLIQAEFSHFARHQDCAVFLLDQMEYNGVIPDREMSQIIQSCFGISSHVYKKYCRMMYWMPKLKNINPFLLPDPLPKDVRELAKLALKKMSVDTRTKIVEYEAADIEESVDKTWIMSAQSPVQQKLINSHSSEKPIFVEGPYLIWLRKLTMSYFILRTNPKEYPKIEVDDDDVSNLSLWMFGEPKPVELTLQPSSVHEQEEGIIMGMCCTGTSSKDSLLSWIRFLTRSNPKLNEIPVLFTLQSSPTSVVPVNIMQKVEESSDKKEATDSI